MPVVVALPLMVEEPIARNPPENVCCDDQVFAVVVPNASEKMPVDELYWIGYEPWSEVEARRPSDEVENAETRPLLARRKPVSEPMLRLVVVAEIRAKRRKAAMA